MSISVVVTAGIVNTFYINQLIVFLFLVVICLIAAIVVFLVIKRRKLNAQQYDTFEDKIDNPYFEVDAKMC